MGFHLISALFTLFIIGRQIEDKGVENRAQYCRITEICSKPISARISRSSEVIPYRLLLK
jgi:hypothetical protein